MAEILTYILISLAMISICMGCQVVRNDRKIKYGQALIITYVGSFLWSMGIGIMISQQNETVAWILRSIGIVGTYIELNGIVFLFGVWSGISKKAKKIVYFCSMSMICVLPFNLHPDYVSFEWTKYGMSYKFAPGLASTIYTLYYVVIAVLCVGMMIYMYRNATRIQQKKLAVKAIMAVFVCAFGMVFDTIIPLLGMNSFPGSTLSQAFSIFFIYNAYKFEKDNSVNIINLSRFVYDLVQEPMLIYDAEYHLRIINNSGMRFLGITENDNEQYPLHELFEVPKDWYHIGFSGKKYEAKCLVNQTFCGLSVDRIEDVYNDSLGYIVLVNDMTEKIETMNQMENARVQAEKANEAKSIFLANMSHEIRTPINAVLGMDEMILRESQAPEIIDYARQIRSASKSLLSLINEILDFSKIESGKMEIVSGTYETGPFFKEIVRVMSFRAKEKNLKITLDMDTNLPSMLWGDEMRVKQIINNIMTNAIKYTSEGEVKLIVRFEANGELAKNSKREKMIMRVDVSDTGSGIAEEQKEKLFESFHRLNESAVHNIEGTGLGLSIVERLLTMMGGSISVESELGKGSIFSVVIPQEIVSKEPVGEIFAKRNSKKLRVENKGKFNAPEAVVLAVDDNRVNLTVLRGLLKRTQVKLDVATGGQEAIDRAKDKRYDLIFMDHMMPEVDGIEAMRAIHSDENSASKDSVIIALTANAIVGMREQYLEQGFDDYLPKPIDSEQLENMMIKYLPGELVNIIPKEQ